MGYLEGSNKRNNTNITTYVGNTIKYITTETNVHSSRT